MAVSWIQFKANVKKFLSDTTASDDLFASACSAYVKAMLCREVDHDLLMSKSYWNYYTSMRRRLLGFTPSLEVGGTLDVAVKILLPVDAEREGVQEYITQQIKNGYQELTQFSTFLDKSIREAVIDLQSYIPCYRVGHETVYSYCSVSTTGNLSKGLMPDKAAFKGAFLLTSVDDLEEEVQYSSGDFVASNGRTYMVLQGGVLEEDALGEGLTTTDGTEETLGGMSFVFYYGEGFFRSEIVQIPWSERFSFNYLKDGCHGNKDMPAVMAIDPEAHTFTVWPKLDTTHCLSIFWSGLKIEFQNGDQVPFDETAESAVRESVLSKYFSQVEPDRLQSQLHEAAYVSLRSRAYVDCRERKLIEFYK